VKGDRSTTKVSAYDLRQSLATDISKEDLQHYVSMVERGELTIRAGPVWRFDQLPLGHQAMDENRANGKMLVVD
jgi:hypothetical protein